MYQLVHITAVAANSSRRGGQPRCLKKYSAFNFRQASLLQGLQTFPLDGITLCPVELFAPLFWFVSLTTGVALALNVHNFWRTWQNLDEPAALHPRLQQIQWVNVRTVRLIMICNMFVAQLALLAGLGAVRPALMDPWLVVQALGVLSMTLLWLIELFDGWRESWWAAKELQPMMAFMLPHLIRAGTFMWAVEYWLLVFSLRRTLAALCNRGLVFGAVQARGGGGAVPRQ